ncbi:MAG TPA: mechanosensitive ion channel domain-containing protein [Terriglobia bacterium]|nr:mechanosensitive ion channel domain-containing protein [Terriglobia bacterium]
MEEMIMRWLFDPTAGKLIAAFVGVVVVYGVVHALKRSINLHVTDADSRYRARKLVSFLGYVTVIIVIATVFSDRLGGLTVTFGVAGAGIAFALQEVIASVAGWVALSFGNFYRPGDRIQLGGIRGDVIDIGVLRTTLMELGEWVEGDLYNGRIVRVSNSFVLKQPVYNYSADFPFLWDEITFPVRYGSDWRYARAVLQRVADEVIGDYAGQSEGAWKGVVQKYLIEDAKIAPLVTIRPDENWIEFKVRYIVDYRNRRSTKDRIFTRILEEVDRSNNRIQIATAGFELLSAPALRVELFGEGDRPLPEPLPIA